MASVQPLSSRQFGRSLPVASRSNRKRKRQVTSTGRGMPLPPQSAVVIKAFFLKKDYEMRMKSSQYAGLESKDWSKFLAPVGSPEAFRAWQGDFAYYLLNSSAPLPQTQIGNPVTNIAAWVHCGGIEKGEEVGFAGWVAVAPDSTNSNSDNLGTLQTAGTCTVVHTGPNLIPVYSTVVFDEYPYMLQDGSSVKPGVLEKGKAADLYRPALYGLTVKSVFAWLQIAQNVVNEFIPNSKTATKLIEKNAAYFTALIPELEAKCYRSELPKSFPLKKYIAVMLANKLITLHGSVMNPGVWMFLKEFLVKPIIDKREKEIRALGLVSSTFGSFLPALAAITEQTFVANKKGEPALSEEEFRKLLTEIGDLRDMVICEMHGWLKQHSIGTALNSAESGAPLDVNMGFFFN